MPGPGGLVEGGVVVLCEEGEEGSHGVGTGVWALGLDDVTAEGGEGDGEDAVEAEERAIFVWGVSTFHSRASVDLKDMTLPQISRNTYKPNETERQTRPVALLERCCWVYRVRRILCEVDRERAMASSPLISSSRVLCSFASALGRIVPSAF